MLILVAATADTAFSSKNLHLQRKHGDGNQIQVALLGTLWGYRDKSFLRYHVIQVTPFVPVICVLIPVQKL